MWSADTLNRDVNEPLHRQIADRLREAIRTGRLTPPAALPPEPELAACLGVARGTVRQAIDVLVREGLLRRRRGQGTFVVDPLPPAPAEAGTGDRVEAIDPVQLREEIKAVEAQLLAQMQRLAALQGELEGQLFRLAQAQRRLEAARRTSAERRVAVLRRRRHRQPWDGGRARQVRAS